MDKYFSFSNQIPIFAFHFNVGKEQQLEIQKSINSTLHFIEIKKPRIHPSIF